MREVGEDEIANLIERLAAFGRFEHGLAFPLEAPHGNRRTIQSILLAGALLAWPLLTERPRPVTPEACHDWVFRQAPEDVNLWGIEPSGTFSFLLALKRLREFCLTGAIPDMGNPEMNKALGQTLRQN